mmetsp:Transcript_17076/g.43097  ORF Transcript_17076/g.43097 Transcript_17076/m.43097 type:complete len:162 (-) Transcript_17076:16-501(-)
MPLYEITSIMRASASQGEVSDLLRRLSQLVLSRNGVIAGVSNWGLHQLTNRMRAHQEYHTHGRYVQLKVIASPLVLRELERNMKLDRNIIRHITLKERNTSIASFANIPPEQLAEAAHVVAARIMQTTTGGPPPHFSQGGGPSGYQANARAAGEGGGAPPS